MFYMFIFFTFFPGVECFETQNIPIVTALDRSVRIETPISLTLSFILRQVHENTVMSYIKRAFSIHKILITALILSTICQRP